MGRHCTNGRNHQLKFQMNTKSWPKREHCERATGFLSDSLVHRSALLTLLIAFKFSLPAGELTIPSSSIGGGGSRAGGSFSVHGGVGETSPAAPVLAGGSFSVSGGFASRIALVFTPGAPRLTLSRTPGGYEISWPLPADGFVLQETSALSAPSPTGWTNAIVSPVDQEGRRIVSLPAVGPIRFFRLLRL
jgi:hypothetical protein